MLKLKDKNAFTMQQFAGMFFFCLVVLHLSALRLSAVSNVDFYLGAPYIQNPLGDSVSSPYTPGPLWRLDGFDCTTYVETILSLRKQNTHMIDFQRNMLSIRYIDGKVGFFSRAHFMEYHWIPNAVRQNFIAAYPLKEASRSVFQLNLQEWFLNNPHVVKKDAAYIDYVKAQPLRAWASIPYVPVRRLTDDLIQMLPDFMVVFFLKEIPERTWPGQEKRQKLVTHMGLLVDKQLYHASSQYKKVLKVNLLDYVQASSTIVGVSFYKVL